MSDIIENILIIGNGFDLAHGLPTKYTDFLHFVAEAKEYCDNFYHPKYININEEDKKGKKYFDFFIDVHQKDIDNSTNRFRFIDKIYQLSFDNLWFNYFNKFASKYNTWIDFESEISKVVKILESSKKNKDKALLYNEEYFFVNKKLSTLLENLGFDPDAIEKNIHAKKPDKMFLKKYIYLTEKLLEDLNRLIRCLEIYLSFYVNSLDNGLRIPEILDLKDSIDYVLSFNYTNTFERFYGHDGVHYDYIHGRATLENTVEDCQLVLGIDEYLNEEERNKNIDFIHYKKLFQRVYKKTGCKYKNWLKEIDDYNRTNGFYIGMKKLNIHILGHSLDITDKDIFKEIVLHNDEKKLATKIKVTIYDHNKESSANHIANLVRIITQDKLINNVYSENGEEPMLEFKPQSPSINIYDTEDQ